MAFNCPLITKPTKEGVMSTTVIDSIVTSVLCCDAFLSGVIITDLKDYFQVFFTLLIHRIKANKGFNSRNYESVILKILLGDLAGWTGFSCITKTM